MIQDSWKRPIAADDAANVMSGYEQQLELQLNKTKDATDEEWNEWQETELKWWGDRQIPIVAFMAFVQLFVFGGMLMAFFLIGKGLK